MDHDLYHEVMPHRSQDFCHLYLIVDSQLFLKQQKMSPKSVQVLCDGHQEKQDEQTQVV